MTLKGTLASGILNINVLFQPLFALSPGHKKNGSTFNTEGTPVLFLIYQLVRLKALNRTLGRTTSLPVISRHLPVVGSVGVQPIRCVVHLIRWKWPILVVTAVTAGDERSPGEQYNDKEEKNDPFPAGKAAEERHPDHEHPCPAGIEQVIAAPLCNGHRSAVRGIRSRAVIDLIRYRIIIRVCALRPPELHRRSHIRLSVLR